MVAMKLRLSLLALGAIAIVAVFVVLPSEAPMAAWRWSVSPGALSPKHAYLSDRCTACHAPTTGVTVENCTSCHANSEQLLGRQPTAFHASVTECTACHMEHQPGNVRPRVMDHVALAMVGARALERASGGDSESDATLSSMKNWLRIGAPDQFDANSARRALNCAGCHDRRDPHFKRFGADCGLCHVAETWLVAGYQHPSPRSQECVQCHQAPPSHYMGHFAMISQRIAGKEHARVDECFACHNTTSWNDIVGVGFYKHH